MLRVALIDDEPLARQALRALLEKHDSLELIAEAESVADAEIKLSEARPDAVFLDIRMPGADGFELLERLDPRPRCIVVTAHPRFAVEAFDIEAVDFLLKPVSATRFAEAVSRLEAACKGEGKGPAYHPRDRICLKTPGRTVVTLVEEICLLRADGDFSVFHIPGEKPLMICQRLGAYEAVLPAPPFLRLDRSVLINTDRIATVNHRSRGETVIAFRGLDEPLTVGRRAWETLRDSGALGA